MNANQPRELPDFSWHGQPPSRGVKENLKGLEWRARGASQLKEKEWGNKQPE